MKIPAWLKPGVWGVIFGALLMPAVGFSQFGWKTESAAKAFADEQAGNAVVAAMVPFCVAKAQAATDQAALAKFNAEQSAYSRTDLLIKAGWATLGATGSPNGALAEACSMQLFAMKPG